MDVSEISSVADREIAVVDMFCGAGGLTHGFVKEGMRVVAGLDSDVSCRHAYEHNNPGAVFMHQKIEDVRPGNIRALYPPASLKVLVGCAPCQPYSTYTRRKASKKTDAGDATRRKAKTETEKWELVATFAGLIEGVQPDIVSMENVTELMIFDGGSIYHSFVKRLKAIGLEVTAHVVYCPDYGIPQKRKRLVLFASRFGEVGIIERTRTPDEYETVDQTIGHLPPIEAGQTCPTDPLHRASSLSELNLRRIEHSVQGGTWRDWPDELRVGCHKKEGGETYRSVYGRMVATEPSPTITTQCHGYGNGRFGHPIQDRAISMREAALLQTFPPDYEFFTPDATWHTAIVGRHIGNAVPVELGRVIARSIRRHISAQQHVSDG